MKIWMKSFIGTLALLIGANNAAAWAVKGLLKEDESAQVPDSSDSSEGTDKAEPTCGTDDFR